MNAKNKSLADFVLYSTVFIAFIFLLAKLRLMSYADDVTFSHALDNTGIIDYLTQRYNTWSGRIVIEAIMVSTITISIFWKIMIPASLIASSYFLWATTLKGTVKRNLGVPISLLLLLCMNASVAGDAQWWVTGFYNYLLPVTCALFLINTLTTSTSTRLTIALALILSFIATSSEQVAVFLVLLIPFLFLQSNNCRQEKMVVLAAYVVVLIGSAITLLSPGSAGRFSVEASRYMPQIIDMNILQKAIIGVDRLVENIALNRNMLFIAALISLLVVIIKKSENNVFSKLYIIIASIMLITTMTSHSFYMKDIDYLTYSEKFHSGNFADLRVYGCYFFYMLTIITMAVGSITTDESGKNYHAFIVILLGSIVTIAIGLSPTAYASGERVLYVFNVSLVIYTLLNMKQCLINKL
ncbi:hypothetical protein [Klebsiella oxytoca]|uniref:hypothetical protein n=1 Tax=Klebsiella oxytoca TaxID=571 RepID=UPI00157B2408|nr:hypothetical protein [Klebsiella oxytoca]